MNDLPGRRNWDAVDFSEVTRQFAGACYAMFWLFAMAALVTYTPATRQEMIRSLRRVGTYGLLAILLFFVFSPLFPSRQRRESPDLRKLLLGTSAFAAVMVFGGVRATCRQIRHDRAAIERGRVSHAGM